MNKTVFHFALFYFLYILPSPFGEGLGVRLLPFGEGLGVSLHAQSFLSHLENNVAGQGKVTVTHDPRLTSIVNGDVDITPKEEEPDDFAMQTGKRKKMRGYRIQMYWGNAQRVDQQKAQRVGTQVTNVYPELQAYTTFEAPHWRCHVGDFATREEAQEYLPKLRRISKDAIIVRSEVFVYQ